MIDKVGKACCGCSACANICPKRCIRMIPTGEGFLYPEIQMDACVHCGLCEKTCPVLHAPVSAGNKCRVAWGAVNRDRRILQESSSGGLFTVLSQEILKNGGCVFGAAFDDNCWSVHHRMAEDNDGLASLRGSKYMQSEIGDAYQLVDEQLKKGRQVLFVGTACQVAGLRSFLGRDDDALFLVDIICHGAPSAQLWQHFLKHLNEKTGRQADNVNFRNKRKEWQRYELTVSSAGKTLYDRPYDEAPYMKMFLRNICLRESCYHCRFKEDGLVSDITLGDFWGVQKVAPALACHPGVSLVLLHTAKGQRLFEQVKDQLILESVNYDLALAGNPSFRYSAPRPEARNGFFMDMSSLSWKGLEKKYGRDPFRVIVRRKLSHSVIGKLGRNALKSLYRRK